MVGHTECLGVDAAIHHWKADGLDLTPILRPATKPHPGVGVTCQIGQDHGLEKTLDVTEIVPRCRETIATKKPIQFSLPIINTNRTVGTILSHEIAKVHGQKGLPTDTIHINFQGSAGQSFGAFLAHGVTLELEGDSNDYVGKGLSGGRIIVYPSKAAIFKAEENILVGNVCLYGATMGEAFLRGRAAERFAVRNSGAYAVIEGVGDHGCEYMTGGRVVILGSTGRNFAAGMSGGIAYVLDEEGQFPVRCNLGLVELEKVENEEDVSELKGLIERHLQFTQSAVAKRVLENWASILPKFVNVMPTDYKRVLEEMKTQATKPQVKMAKA
jgi:glutamate synthase (NADPH/NADH) large chain